MEENKATPRWSKTAVTDIGTALLAEFAAGRILNITAAYGSVGADDNLIELEELPDGRAHPLTIESVTRTDNSVTACIQVTSLGNPSPYKMDRIGLYAVTKDPGETQEPDDPGGGVLLDDKLLMVVEDTEDEQGRKGVTIPAETDQLYTFKLYAVLTITNKDRLEVSVSTAGIATLGAIDDAMEKHNQDPEAHPGMMEKFAGGHNDDPEAHPGMTARIRATEIALNGSETILAPEGDPTTETEGVKGQHYINLDTGAEFVCNDITDDGYIWGPVDTKTSMRNLLAQTAETAKQAKDVADGAAQAIAAVQNTISVIPSQSGGLTYNGSAQRPSWNNYAVEMMEVTYGDPDDPEARITEADFQGQTDAGTYMAYFKPKGDYTWGDKSKTEKAVPWSIQRATITTAPSVTGTLTYNGGAQTPTWQSFNSAQLTKEETAQTNAGTYSTAFTPTKNYQWSGGDTSARTVPWTIGRATVAAVPEQSGSLTYTGSAQSPTWNGYDSAKLTISRDTTGINAGNYTAAFTPTPNYQWSDGGTGAKTAPWSIGKAAGSLTLDKTAMTLNSSNKFSTIAVNRAGNGAISAQSSNTKVATVDVSGDTVLVTGVADGSATITIKVAEGSNHTAPQNKTCGVTVNFSNVFGVCWNKTTSTALTRLTPSNDPNSLVTVSITGNPSPAVGTGAGSSPFDAYAPWKDMEEYNIINNAVSHKRGAAGFSRTNYDTMVYIPEFWFKITESGGKRYFYISSGAKNGFTKHPGSGKYVARYNTINGYFSKSGAAPLGSMTRATARTQSKAKGSKWSQYDFASWNAVWLLYLVEFADWNSQAKIGRGNVEGGSIQNNGGTDSMTYHTGRAAGTDGKTQVQYRHIENPWGNIWEWIDGANFNARKSYICTNPANYADDTTANYTDAGVTLPSSGWIKDLGMSNNFPWAFLPNTSGGSETTYIPDYVYSSAGWCVLMVGGHCGSGSGAGLLYFHAYDSSSVTSGSIGARLLYHP